LQFYVKCSIGPPCCWTTHSTTHEACIGLAYKLLDVALFHRIFAVTTGYDSAGSYSKPPIIYPFNILVGTTMFRPILL